MSYKSLTKSVTCNRNAPHCSDYEADMTAQSDSWIPTYALQDQKPRFDSRIKCILHYSNCPDCYWGPTSPPFKWKGVLFLQGHSGWCPKPTIHIHLVPSFRTCRSMPPLPPHTFGTRCWVISGLVTDGLNCRRAKWALNQTSGESSSGGHVMRKGSECLHFTPPLQGIKGHSPSTTIGVNINNNNNNNNNNVNVITHFSFIIHKREKAKLLT